MLNRNTLFLYRESLEELLQELPDRIRCLRISCCLLGRHHSCPRRQWAADRRLCVKMSGAVKN